MTERVAFGTTADNWLEQSLNQSLLLPLGCKGLDDILGGGVQSQQILEIVGQTATGKTQLCLHCILHTVVAADEATAIYIDTGNSFSSSRIAEMFSAQVEVNEEQMKDEMAPEESPEEFLAHVLSKIECYQAFDAFKTVDILENIYNNLKTQNSPFYRSLRLIVIDSLGAVISPILGGNQMIGHGVMMQISRILKILAHEFNVAIVVSNIFIIHYTF